MDQISKHTSETSRLLGWRQQAPTALLIWLVLFLPCLAIAESEVAVACPEGPAAVDLAYGEHTSGCRINLNVDIDVFTFTGAAGDEIRLVIEARSDYMDPYLEIWGPDGTKLHEGTACGNLCSASFEVPDFNLPVPSLPNLPLSGVYTIWLSDAGANETGNYQVSIHCLQGGCPVSDVVSYSTVLAGSIDHKTDLDSFQFYGEVGSEVRFVIYAQQDYMDPRMEIWDPDGVKLHNNSCGNLCSTDFETTGFSILPSGTLPKTGYYQLKLSDVNYDEGGQYRIAIHCLLGADCPAPLPPLPLDTRTTGSVSPPGDMDFFLFEGLAGSQLRFVVDADSDYMDPVIEIWDPVGVKVTRWSCTDLCTFDAETNEFTFVPSNTLALSGSYLVGVSDSGNNETGSYALNVHCLLGPCETKIPRISYVTQLSSSISPTTDMNFYSFEGIAGTQIRIAVDGRSDYMDPVLELWDPYGVKLTRSSCTDLCSFAVETSAFTLQPSATLADTGTYRLGVSDAAVNQSGNYKISIHCLEGPCDSDADGARDPDPIVLKYGVPFSGRVNSSTDMDFFAFWGIAGTNVRITVSATGDYMDPNLELWDPLGGAPVDANGCSGLCTIPAWEPAAFTETGIYQLAIRDSGWNELGNYQVSIMCLGPGCVDLAPYPLDADNCVEIENGPLVTDLGGHIQRDTNGDGYGNVCDSDFNQDALTDFLDLGIMKGCFFSSHPDCEDMDMNGSGMVDFLDLGLLKRHFFRAPGPSGLICAGTIPCPAPPFTATSRTSAEATGSAIGTSSLSDTTSSSAAASKPNRKSRKRGHRRRRSFERFGRVE